MSNSADKGQDRLYQDLVRDLRQELASGLYPVGARLPAERELAARFGVSRPTVREALIALEVQGLIEVRVGSGAHVRKLPGAGEGSAAEGFNVSGFELSEARLLFESEAAALAATQATEEDLAEIARLVEEIARENADPDGTERADRQFHVAIARATRNAAIYDVIERLWDLRAASPEAALLHAKARSANIKPVVVEHAAILDALRRRDPDGARAAMRAHLTQVIDSLLFATEERQIAEARKAAQAKRERYARFSA
ncbi:transcriptional regulator, GntR family [Novosphingobium sp. CF614]|uniref:FadR/GntR family transcriptional regulator n=1 Tax=Novosphingobium sp. CF614 TaxID=1884364 RepID=UPI0008EB5337|nr:FadR/GntR family transcriptional regulator [Novosphingobium sp. CF614]SFG08212.1 transcriptional regulator, GntR family [Novosphingobium sp. CF614]